MSPDITDDQKIIAIIPCLNEERFIADIVERARKQVAAVIVVDDGSTDGTAAAALNAGAEVIKHGTRQGAGAATRTGFEAALKHGADIAVTLDGDGQHNPDEIPQLIQPVIKGQADLVIGSRFLRKADVPRYRKFGIDVITFMYNFGCRDRTVDGQSGFRAYSRKAMLAINITRTGFGFSIQTLVQARKHGMRIREAPVSCIYHDAGSTQNPITHGLGVAWEVVKIRIQEELFGRSSSQKQ